MHQRDYVLRIIEELGSVLAELRNRILGRAVESKKVDEELAGAAGRAGLDLELLRRFSVDTLHMFAAPTGEIEPARCWLMAEVLYLDGLHAHLEERIADAQASLSKAHMLYTLIEPGGGMLVGFPEAAERLQEIDSLVTQIVEVAD